MRRIVAVLVLVIFASAESLRATAPDSLQMVRDPLVKDCIFKSLEPQEAKNWDGSADPLREGWCILIHYK